MTNRWLLGLMIVVPAAAHADAQTDAASALQEFALRLDRQPLPGFVLAEPRWKPVECTKAIDKAKKAGVKPTDALIGAFERHPKAKKTAQQYKFEITFGDADWICSEYTAKFHLESAAAPIREAADFMADHKTAPTAETARGYNTGAGKATGERGTKCLKSIEQAIKDGVPATTKLKTKLGELSLEDAKAVCRGMIDYGTKFEELIAVEQKAKRAERAKKYEEVGIKGAKLELFIEYDDVHWRGRGCEIVDDIKLLAKATRLYHWLENSDGTHTIRTYLFAGNAVKGKSERTYQTEAAAYRGCP